MDRFICTENDKCIICREQCVYYGNCDMCKHDGAGSNYCCEECLYQ